MRYIGDIKGEVNLIEDDTEAEHRLWYSGRSIDLLTFRTQPTLPKQTH
jgi:hypothetical protein